MLGLDFKQRDWIMVGLLSALFCGGAWAFFFVCDDAFISFRYARNLALGQGFRFNPADPPVEGFSNLLWVLIAAVLEGVLMSPVVWMPVLSILTGLLLILCWWRVVTRDLQAGPVAAGLAGGFLVLCPVFLVWASSGLETLPFALAIFVLAEVAFLRDGRVSGAVGALAMVALVTLRPEGAGWAGVILVLAGWARHRTGRSLRPVAWAGVLLLTAVAAMTGFRLWVFGDWLPNTARVKVGMGIWLLLRGVKYVTLLGLSVPALVGSAVGLLALLRRGAPWQAWAVLAAGFPVWAVVMGGDFFPLGRMLVPMVPILALGVAAALDGLPAGRARALGGVLIGLQVLAVFDLQVVPQSVRSGLHFRHSDLSFMSEVGRWNNMRDNTDAFVKRGRALAEVMDPDTVIVTRAIGAVGYYGDLTILDQYGLVDPEVARRNVLGHPSERSPGHDKEVDVSWFAPQNPDLIYARHVSGANGATSMQRALKRWPIPHDLRSQYVPDFVEVDLEPDVDEWLFMVRRLREGESSAHARREFERRRLALAASFRTDAGSPEPSD